MIEKIVILITGTPCVGKTSTAKLLSKELDALYINLTKLAVKHNLVLGKDRERNSLIVDEKKMKQKSRQTIQRTHKKYAIIDGHYAVNVVPSELIDYVFVLRRDPIELRKLMQKCGFQNRKLSENLASEILDVCLFDALNLRGKAKICELDVTSKTREDIVAEILNTIKDTQRCCVGIVDWLGKLEKEGLLDEYLEL